MASVIKRRFTADEYQRMGQVGILPKHGVELMDGEVLTMTPFGPRHVACVSRTTHALVKAVGDDAIVQPQGSVRAAAGILEYWLADLNANVVWRYLSPERGAYRKVEPYRRGHTIAPHLLPSCVVEVDVLLTE